MNKEIVFYMNCWLRIIFIGILSCLILQGIEKDGSSVWMEEICHENILSTDNENCMSFEESSSDTCLIRTINHILKSIYADLPIPVCIISTGVKDNNNDNKSILNITGGLARNNITYRLYKIDAKHCTDCHNLIHSPKDYYIYTLEKIII